MEVPGLNMKTNMEIPRQNKAKNPWAIKPGCFILRTIFLQSEKRLFKIQ